MYVIYNDYNVHDLIGPVTTEVIVNSTTATTISLSWAKQSNLTIITWERDTSGECSYEDKGSATITNVTTSHTITGLEEDSSYILSVTAIAINVDISITGHTKKDGKKNCTYKITNVIKIIFCTPL